MQEDKTNGSKQKLSKREKAQSSMQQEDKLKCEFLIGTMDMGSWVHLILSLSSTVIIML
jgi:hypothetical protein